MPRTKAFFEGISKLIQKEAIEIVPYANSQIGFYSTLFLVRQKTGDLRPVISLKPLNKCIVKKHFKMDTLAKTLNLIKVEDWAISLDLKDAYFHIPIQPHNRQFLRFSILNTQYQFKAMCFGPTQAPRVFMNVVSVVTAYLRMHNIRLVAYLDDWLILNNQKEMLLRDREKVLNLLTQLGFIINAQKSQLLGPRHRRCGSPIVITLSVCLSVRPSVYLSVRPSVRLSVCPSFCPSTLCCNAITQKFLNLQTLNFIHR